MKNTPRVMHTIIDPLNCEEKRLLSFLFVLNVLQDASRPLSARTHYRNPAIFEFVCDHALVKRADKTIE